MDLSYNQVHFLKEMDWNLFKILLGSKRGLPLRQIWKQDLDETRIVIHVISIYLIH